MVTLTKEDIQAIAVVDIDQTLIEGEGDQSWKGESWFLLTAGFGAQIDEHKEIFSAFRESINGDQVADNEAHDDMALQLINLWEESLGEPITRKHLDAVCEFIKTRVEETARAAIEDLISNGILVIIGTGGFENSAQAIANLLETHNVIIEDVDTTDLKMWFGNTEFIFDGDGEDAKLVTFHHKKDIIGYKQEQAEKKIQEIIDLLDLDEDIPVIAIGDGESDLALFLDYYGIAFKPTSAGLKMTAQAVVEDWDEVAAQVIAHINWLEDEEEINTTDWDKKKTND